MTQRAFHPLANLFPLLEGEPFAALVADIAASGLCEAVWLYQGQILDGRNRYRACQQLGISCPTRDYEGEDPLGFVISMNLRRRHLDESQRAIVAARLATMRQGERTDLVEISTKLSQEQAAALLHVSRASVVAAKKVLQDGAPEIAHTVEAGDLAVSAAVPLTALPREDQLTALQEAQRDATGKTPTAKQTRTVVRRRQGAATVTAERDDHPQETEAVRAAFPSRLLQLLEPLEALATVPDLEQLLLDMPPEWYDRVDQSLASAFDTLRRLRTIWKQHRHEVSEESVRPETSQRRKQPTKGRTRRTTKRAQPALFLQAIRTASQPLTIEALRQMPGVERSRMKRNVDRLVAQGKIRETPQGYVVVSP